MISNAQELTNIKQLITKCHFKEALQEIERLEQLEGLISDMRLTCTILKSTMLEHLGEYSNSLQLAEHAVTESQKFGTELQVIDALLAKAKALRRLNRLGEALKTLESGEAKLKTITHALPREILSRKAALLQQKGRFYVIMGEDLERALEYTQQSLALGKQLGEKLLLAEVYLDLGMLSHFRGDFNQALQHYNQSLTLCEELGYKQGMLPTFMQISALYSFIPGDFNQALAFSRKALALAKKLHHRHYIVGGYRQLGYTYQTTGDFNQALKYTKKSLTLCKEFDLPDSPGIILLDLGRIYAHKGDLDRALDYFQQALANFEESERKLFRILALQNIGTIYRQKGEWEQALAYFQQSFILSEEMPDSYNMGLSLFWMISVALDMNALEHAQQYLQQLNELHDQVNLQRTEEMCRVAEALILKTRGRPKHRGKAEELFEQIVEEEGGLYELKIAALLNLCELLLAELRYSNDPEVLNAVQSQVTRLREIATQQHSHWLLAETYIFQSKLALVELNIPAARQYLEQAQQLAEERGLRRLAMQISTEHDTLLDQLEQWEELINRNASVRERAEFAQLEQMVGRMIRKRGAELPDPTEEEPVLLLIFGAETGLSVFSKQFRPATPLDEHLIAGFLTAMNAFGRDAFAAGPIERIKYADYTVLLRPVEPFLMCYVIQGDSYYALQKLTQFVDDLQTLSAAWESLLEVTKVGRGPLVRVKLGMVDELAGEIFRSN